MSEPVQLSQLDFAFMDINETAYKKLNDLMKIKNLSPGSFTSPPFPATDGCVLMPNNRLMICLNCQRAQQSPDDPIVKVWFIFVTSCHETFISQKTINALLGQTDSDHKCMKVAIQDPNSVNECYRSHGRFAEANILGTRTMEEMKLNMENMNWSARTWSLTNRYFH